MSTEKKKRGSWAQHDLEAAVGAVQTGRLSSYKAADTYKIPRRTLRDYVKSGMSKLKLGRKTVFTGEQERDFVKRVIRFADLGIPLTAKLIRKQAFVFCERYQIPNTFNKQLRLAGRDWLKLFLKRNRDIAKRKAQFLNQARGQKLNKTIVTHHFKEIKNIYDELGIHYNPERLYNMDEKGCRLTMHKQPTVIAQKGAKRVHLQASEHGENVTIVGCANALGNTIPPMIIFKGVRKKPEFEANLPPGATVRMAQKGSMTTELFIDFLRHFAKYKTAGNCLLIFDGAKCHLDFRIAEEADVLSITLYCLPSNTTHELQPLDKACYKPFESYWDQEVLQHFYDETHAQKITRPTFNKILSKIWSKCMTYENITSGFKATGLYPFNPDVLPESAFAPSVLTEKEAPPNADGDKSRDVPLITVDSEELEYLDILSDGSRIENRNTFDILSSASRITPSGSLTASPTPQGTSPRSLIVNPTPHVTPPRLHIESHPSQFTPPPHHTCQRQSSYRSPVPSTSYLPITKKLVDYSSSTGTSDFEETSDTEIITRGITVSRIQLFSRIYSSETDSETDHEEDVPLAQLSGNSQFELFMPTPNYAITKKRPRRKALNYKGQRITKDLFNDTKEVKKKTKATEIARGNETEEKKKKKTDDKQITKTEKSNKRKLVGKNTIDTKTIKTKELKTNTSDPRKKTSPKMGKENKTDGWYCHACHEDRVADMRPCVLCNKWYHEECIGLTKNDVEEFKCPDGCD